MSLAASIPIAPGTLMPPFELEDARGGRGTGGELYGAKGLLVVFTCGACPCAGAAWPRLAELSRVFALQGVNAAAINPNAAPGRAEESAESMRETLSRLRIDLPYLLDPDQAAARAFGARCTPEPFLYDAAHRLVYHGRFDSLVPSAPELEAAMEALSEGRAFEAAQRPAKGCAISRR